MDYQKEFIIDFARRTRANLEFVEAAQKDGNSVYEVTQLANSLLGLLVFPREQYIKSIPNTPLSELVDAGWPAIRSTRGKLPQETLRRLMQMLRNSIAHCNVEFVAGPEMQIVAIKVWNSCLDKTTNRQIRTWQAELSIPELRAIAFKFVELIERGNRNGDTA